MNTYDIHQSAGCFSPDYLLSFACTGSSFAVCRLAIVCRVELLSSCSERASLCSGFSCCAAQAPGTRACLVAAWKLSCCGVQLWGMRASVVVTWMLNTGSVVMVHRLSCSRACGIFPDQELNPCPLHCPPVIGVYHLYH